MTIKEALSWANQELKKGSISEPEASSVVLLASVLGVSRTDLMTKIGDEIRPALLKKFQKMVARRFKNEPVWHIIGRVEFYGLPFLVTRDVLTPRPETELLVQEAFKEFSIQNSKFNRNSKLETRNLRVLDLGTGSGAIAISLAQKFPKAKVTATDISAKALKVAKKNASLNKVARSIKFVKSDLFDKVKGEYGIITANLPYIPSGDFSTLQPEVRDFEPKGALISGDDGLDLYRKMLAGVKNHLDKDGIIFCEIGIGQGPKVREIVKKYLPQAKAKIIRDFADIDRVAIIR